MFGIKSRKALTKRGIKKVDALITGLILGGIVTSIYGIKRIEKEREQFKQEVLDESDRHTLGSILRMLVFGFQKAEEEKPTLRLKILRFFRL